MYVCMYVIISDRFDHTTTYVVGSPVITPAPTSCYRGKDFAVQAGTVLQLYRWQSDGMRLA